jgi:uncharacterized membrane protein YoaK (UPF0700 family)
LILVSGPAAFFAHGSVAWLTFAICAVILFALLIAAATVRHRPARPVFMTFAVVWSRLLRAAAGPRADLSALLLGRQSLEGERHGDLGSRRKA